jgi:hypothetical protein
MDAEICIPCKEMVARYPGEAGCPFCGGPVTTYGDYIDIVSDLLEEL